MGLHRNSKRWKIIKAIAIAGGILTVVAFSGAGGARALHAMLKSYIRKKRFEREKFLRDLKHLQDRELIDYQELPNGEIEMVLKKKGEQEMVKFNLDEMKLNTTRRWDHHWRLVIFDIPHDKKAAREALREKLRELGFYGLQKSVFITPYECEKEIDFIGSVFEVRQHILILLVRQFEGEEKLRHHFSL